MKERMERRLKFYSGEQAINNHNREVWGRKMTLKKAIESGAYHTEQILLLDEETNEFTEPIQCLIVPETLSTNLDVKRITLPEEDVLQEGDTFLWERTNTVWMVTNRELSAEGVFTAIIRKCVLQIDKWWVWINNPVQGSDISEEHSKILGDMNGKIDFFVKKSEESLDFFSRYNIINVGGHRWRIGGTDKLTQPNIIEVVAEEYFDINFEQEEPPNEEESVILGDKEVYPFDTDIEYEVQGLSGGTFKISDTTKAKITSSSDNKCTIDVLSKKSGEFELIYETNNSTVKLLIKIKSL